MKKHILVVDDEIGALTLIGIMLERGGFNVLKTKDAHIALTSLDERTPDLIILDVMMPDMDGIELCKVIRQRSQTEKTPVLILSARGDAESIIRGIEAGANDYLPKPILHHDLVAKVRAMLDLSVVKRGEPPTVAVEILDEQGRDLSDKVVSDPKRVTVRPVFVASAPRRYLPIVPTWAGALPAGYVFVRNHEVRPQQVQVSGDTAVVGKLFSLETEPINLTDIRGTRRVQVKLKTPRGVRLLGPASVTVTVYAAQAPARGG